MSTKSCTYADYARAMYVTHSYMLHQGCTKFVLWRLIVVDPQSGPCCMTLNWRLKFGDGF